MSSTAPPRLDHNNGDYESWKKCINIWKNGTSVVAKKQGSVIVSSSLGGKHLDVAFGIPEDELHHDDGVKNLLKALDQVFLEDTKDVDYKAFLEFENIRRSSDEGIRDFIMRFDKVKKSVTSSDKLVIDKSILGKKLLSASNISEAERMMIFTACSSTDYEEIQKALKRIIGCVSTTTRNTEPLGFPIKSEVLFNEPGRYQGRYNTNRDQNSSQRIRRGYDRTRRGNYNPRDNVGNITKCSRCGSIYHWANRCPSSSRGTGQTMRRANRGQWNKTPRTSPNSYTDTYNTELQYYANMEYGDSNNHQPQDYGNEDYNDAQDPANSSYVYEQEEYNHESEQVYYQEASENNTYWTTECADEQVELEKVFAASINMFTNSYRPVSEVFVVESYEKAIVDTACARTCCGIEWYENFKQQWGGKIIEKPTQAWIKFGSANPVQASFTALLPIRIADKDLTLECEVLPTKVPLLLSNTMLGDAETLIDVKREKVTMFGIDLPVSKSSNGHFLVNVMRTNKADATEEYFTKENVTFMMTAEDQLDKAQLLKLHKQFGHASYDKLKSLLKAADRDSPETMKLLKEITEQCKICITYRRTPPTPKNCLPRAKSFNESVAVDLHQFKDGTYMLHMIDEFSRYSVGALITTKKTEVFVKAFVINWARYFGYPRSLFFDNGGEFNSNLVREFAENFNINIITTAAYSPWSNGTVERHNGILCLMIAKLCETYPDFKDLDYMIAMACAAKNSLSNKNGFTPNQIVFGTNANYPSVLVNKLPALECNISSKDIKDHLALLHSARQEFLKAESNTRIMKALKRPTVPYRGTLKTGELVYYKDAKEKKWRGPVKVVGMDNVVVYLRHGGQIIRVHRTRISPCKEVTSDMNGVETAREQTAIIPSMTVRTETIEGEEQPENEINIAEEPDKSNGETEQVITIEEETSEKHDDQTTKPRMTIDSQALQKMLEEEKNDATESVEEEESDAETEKNTVNVQLPANHKDKLVLKKGDTVRFKDPFTSELIEVKVMGRSGKAKGKWRNWYNFEQPDTGIKYAEDITELPEFEKIDCSQVKPPSESEVYIAETEIFKEAKQTELEVWKQYEVYKEVNRETVDQKILGTTWVCNLKNGRAKARLTVRGFMEDKNAIPSASPTCNKETIRIIMTIAATKRWTLNSLDVKAAFLQGKTFVREVYIFPPDEAGVKEGIVWKLLKCVYGLVDASLTWYNTLKALFLTLGGEIAYDPALFVWKKDGVLMGLLSIHVDDFVYAGDEEFIDSVMANIRTSFEIRLEQSKTFQFLGLDVNQDMNDYSIVISQQKFLDNLQLPNLELNGRTKEDKLEPAEVELLRGSIGKLISVTNQTNPTVSYDVCVLGSSVTKATVGDYKHCMKVIRQVKTSPLSIKFQSLGSCKDVKLLLFTDASLNNRTKGRSQGGYLIFIVGANGSASLIAWRSRRQSKVARHTLEAETIALADGLDFCLYVVKILKSILNCVEIPIICKCDNRDVCTAVVSDKEVSNKRLALEVWALKELISNFPVVIEWISGDFQLADILTKVGVSNKLLTETLAKGVLTFF